MPSRFVSLAILIYWSIAAFLLLTWDVLPELTLGYAPDLRRSPLPAIRAGRCGGAFRSSTIRGIRTCGGPWANRSRRRRGEPDGWFELKNHVDLDAGGLLRGNSIWKQVERAAEVESLYLVDSSGNLSSFDLKVTRQEIR